MKNFLYNQHAMETDFSNFLTDKVRKKALEIPRVSVMELDTFNESYIDKPFVISSDRKTNCIDFKFFEEHAGDIEVDIDLYETKKTQRNTIKFLIEQIRKSTPDDPLYLQEWWYEQDFPELDNALEIPSCFAHEMGEETLGFSTKTLWIGAAGALTPIHEDTWDFNLVTTQLAGRKEWFLFHKDSFLNTKDDGTPDYDEFFSNPKNACYSVVLEAGDTLYMPCKWWHRTKTLEHAASFNMTYISPDILQSYTQSVLSLPILLALRGEELKRLNPMRYSVTKQRVEMISKLIGFDPDYLINAIKNAD